MHQDILYIFFQGRATTEEELMIREWVEKSPENKRSFLKQRKLFDAMCLLKDENDMQKILSDKKKDATNRRVYISRELLKIASVAIVVFIISYFWLNKPGEGESIQMQTITVPPGQRINILLPDGTNAWLNARTTIQYPISFNKDKRLIRLDGQAYFDVKYEDKTPFIVETSKGRIRVLGTKFDVLSYSESDQFETALMDGTVQVSLMEDLNQIINLTPGNKVYLVNHKLHQTSLTDYNPYRWKEGLISFENSPFAGIMKEFEKSYGIQIIIRNKVASNYSYTGKFRVVDGLDYALKVLQKDIKFAYERDTESNILYIN